MGLQEDRLLQIRGFMQAQAIDALVLRQVNVEVLEETELHQALQAPQ